MSIYQQIPSAADIRRATSKDPLRRMHQVYGERAGASCENCCNCQKTDHGSETTLVCIAYSPKAPWNRQSRACYNMYNIPFRGIRPRIRPLEDMFPKTDDEAHQKRENIEGQNSLF